MDSNHQQFDYRHRQPPIGTSGKLDVHQRNTYNRTNHNRYQSSSGVSGGGSVVGLVGHSAPTSLLPQVVVCDVTTGTTTSSSAYHHSSVVHHSHHQQSPLPPTSSSTHPSSYADNNNHSQFSALHNLHNQINRYAQPSSAVSTGGTTPATVGGEPDPYWDETADSRRFTERRKKTVRFDGQDSDDWTRWESERQGSQDSATKDSGIDTSSTFTSSEDSNRGDGPKV